MVIVRLQRDTSLSPGDDVEQAIHAGSTEVVIEVTKWGKVILDDDSGNASACPSAG